MQALFSEFNENVLLALQKDQRIVFIKHISSNHLMNIRIEPDPDYPMHVTAAGRAILAFLPEKEIDAYIQKAVFEKITSKTVASENAREEPEIRRNPARIHPEISVPAPWPSAGLTVHALPARDAPSKPASRSPPQRSAEVIMRIAVLPSKKMDSQ